MQVGHGEAMGNLGPQRDSDVPTLLLLKAVTFRV